MATQQPADKSPTSSSSSGVQYLYTHYHRKWVVDWPSSVSGTCTVRIIYIDLASLYMLFVRLFYYDLFHLFYSFVRFIFPLFAFLFAEAAAGRPRRSRNSLSRYQMCVYCPARSATPDSSGRRRLLPPCMGIDSGNETFRSSPYIDTLGYEQHGSPSWRLRDLT